MAESHILSASMVRRECGDLFEDHDRHSQLRLALVGKGLSLIEDVGIPKKNVNFIRKVDLSNNSLTRLVGLHALNQVTWINVSNNKLTGQALADITHMSLLTVLNASHNAITSIPSSALSGQRDCLKALVLNDNRITDASAFAKLAGLNSLILSHNKLKTFDCGAFACKYLAKLSLAHNKLSSMSGLHQFPRLAELRLNDNSLTNLPVGIDKCTHLRVLDLGRNAISTVEALKPLATLQKLRNLTIAGNSVVDTFSSKDECIKHLLTLCPGLWIVDGKKINSVSAKSDATDSASEDTRIHQTSAKRPRSKMEDTTHRPKDDVEIDEQSAEHASTEHVEPAPTPPSKKPRKAPDAPALSKPTKATPLAAPPATIAKAKATAEVPSRKPGKFREIAPPEPEPSRKGKKSEGTEDDDVGPTAPKAAEIQVIRNTKASKDAIDFAHAFTHLNDADEGGWD